MSQETCSQPGPETFRLTLVVLNARERVACYRRKSREPVIGQRKYRLCRNDWSAHFWADIGFEIRLRLVSGVNDG